MLDERFDKASTVSSISPKGRRLTDKLMVAFHQACDQSEFEVANALITLVEEMLQRIPSHDRRRRVESLVAAYERLWFLKHGGYADAEEVPSMTADSPS
jgi:hypothetical protein